MNYIPLSMIAGLGLLGFPAFHPLPALADGHNWTLWWQNTSGDVATWQMSGTVRLSSQRVNHSPVNPDWRVVGTGDFTGDNRQDDLAWQNQNGSVAMWCTDGTNCTEQFRSNPAQLSPGWNVTSTGDINGDGHSDLVCEHTNGWLGVWIMNGTNAAQQYLNPSKVDPNWKVRATADLNGDHHTDVVFQHNDGRVAAWFMRGTNQVSSTYLNPSQVDPNWQIVGAVDLNGDAKKEILWRHKDGRISYWQMRGTNRVGGGSLTPARVDPSWQIVGPQ